MKAPKKPAAKKRTPKKAAAKPASPTTRIPAEKWDRFIDLVAQTADITRSCAEARISREAAYQHRKRDAAFAARWRDAVTLGTAALEDEAVRRAFEGTLKPVFQGGKQVGTVREYSDRLLELMLKARKPGVYRERVETKLTGSVKVERVHELSDEELAAIAAGGRSRAAAKEEGEK